MGSFSQLSVQLSQIHSWKFALVGAFTPQKLTNTTNQSSPTPRQPFASTPLPVKHVSGVLQWRSESSALKSGGQVSQRHTCHIHQPQGTGC